LSRWSASAPIPLQPAEDLFADLRSRSDGLSSREVERRLTQYGPNEIVRRGRRRWLRDVTTQLTHPLALLLWAAGVLAWFAGTPILAGAIVGVILLNAAFALLQERQAERAVEALAAFLPEHVAVLRDGRRCLVEARSTRSRRRRGVDGGRPRPRRAPAAERRARAGRGALDRPRNRACRGGKPHVTCHRVRQGSPQGAISQAAFAVGELRNSLADGAAQGKPAARTPNVTAA